MNIRTLNIRFFKEVIIITLLVFNSGLLAQNNVSKTTDDELEFNVSFYNKITSNDDLKEETGFFKSVKNFILGKNKTSLLKPVNLITIDSSYIIILDQGIQFPVIINNEKKTIEIIEEKKTFPSLIGLCRWKDNKVLFTDSKLNKIYYFSLSDLKPVLLNDKLSLEQPTGIGYSTITDEIWVSETGKHQITILDSQGNIKKVIGTRGTNKGQFNFPTHISIAQNGKVFIVDAMNFRIQLYNSSGEFLSMFGETGDSPGYFSSIKGISNDSFGHIYIVDALFNVVQVFNENGTFLHTFGGQGTENGQFYLPSGICIAPNNNIYVADTYNSRIQIFQLTRGLK